MYRPSHVRGCDLSETLLFNYGQVVNGIPFIFSLPAADPRKHPTIRPVRHILTVLMANLLVVRPIVREINVRQFLALQEMHPDVRLDGFARKSRVRSE